MADEYQSLLMNDLEISVPGLTVRRLALNRHMPKVEKVRAHDHPYEQLLLYLRGCGVQKIGSEKIPVRRGSLIFLQRQQRHSFWKEKNASPICLVVDFKLCASVEWPKLTHISGGTLQSIETGLHRLSTLGKSDWRFDVGAGVLGILGQLEPHLRGDRHEHSGGPLTARVKEYIEDSDLAGLTPGDISRALGKEIEVINRQLKAESDLSVAKLLATVRFDHVATRLRETDLPISEIAEEIGILDQNYFSRWFRNQAGITPTQWRRNA